MNSPYLEIIPRLPPIMMLDDGAKEWHHGLSPSCSSVTTTTDGYRSPLNFPEKQRCISDSRQATPLRVDSTPLDTSQDRIPHRPSDWPPLVALTTAAVQQQQQQQEQQQEQQQQLSKDTHHQHHHGVRLHPPPALSDFPPRILTAGMAFAARARMCVSSIMMDDGLWLPFVGCSAPGTGGGQSHAGWSFHKEPVVSSEKKSERVVVVNDGGRVIPPNSSEVGPSTDPFPSPSPCPSPATATALPTTTSTTTTTTATTYALPSVIVTERMKWAFQSLYQHLVSLESVYQLRDGATRRVRACHHFLEPLEWNEFSGELRDTLKSGAGYDRALCLNAFLRKADTGLYQSLEQMEIDVHLMCSQIQRITARTSLAYDDANLIMVSKRRGVYRVGSSYIHRRYLSCC